MIAIGKETILSNIELIKSTIESFQGVDIELCMDYLNEIVSLQATATETLASAKYHHLEAINEELDRQARLMGNDKVAPSIKKMRAEAMCREWEYVECLCERLCANISHTIDAVRTKISYYKQEMSNSKFVN